jgi:hypothetical protein
MLGSSSLGEKGEKTEKTAPGESPGPARLMVLGTC